MIIRKPYAFLIKNFKKIHIFLLVLAVFIYFKSTQTFSFLNEFLKLKTYDIYNEPITDYINLIGIISLLLLTIGSVSLLFLLKRKDKPWKLYLVPVVQYALLLLTFLFVRSYFVSYTGVESTAPMRAWRDILLVSQGVQLAPLVLFVIRIFGIDLNKFNFKLDEEYLELEQGDKEELEININIDKASFKRIFKRLMRNLNYIYQEHKLLCRLIILIFLIFMVRNTYNYINSHRSFKEGDTFNVNGYTIKINDSYYSDKSYNGDIISKKSSFIVVDLSITNNVNKTRDVDFNKYHIINGVSNYSPTSKTYETEFKDLGKSYDTFSLKGGETGRLIIIFKVDNKLKKNRFVLYYQESNGNTKSLRKIKLNIKDLSKIETKETISLGDVLPLNIKGDEESIIFEYGDIESVISYTYKTCTTINCTGTEKVYSAPTGYKILRLAFGSDTYEGTEMANFVADYGKITYKTRDGKTKTIDAVNALNKSYYGKYIYLKVPQELETATSISLDFIIRNNKYVYKII